MNELEAELYIRENRKGIVSDGVELMQTAMYGNYPYAMTYGEGWYPYGLGSRKGNIIDLAQMVKEGRVTHVSFYRMHSMGNTMSTVAVFPKTRLLTRNSTQPGFYEVRTMLFANLDDTVSTVYFPYSNADDSTCAIGSQVVQLSADDLAYIRLYGRMTK
jgi:hypothetical protein